jgi:hypothetical protein
MQEVTPQQDMDFQERMIDKQHSNDPNSIYADSMREEKIKNVIAQLNPELLLTEIEHRIRGEKKNTYTEEWELISGENKVSEKLVQNYISFLNVYLTQNNSLSNYSPQEINSIMEVVIDYIKDDLTDNAIDYGLTTRETIEVETIVKELKMRVMEDGSINYIEIPRKIKKELIVGEEITDYNTLTKIGHIVCQSTFSVLKQAQNGMLASRIFKALRVTENLGQGGQKSKLDFLKFW